MADGSRINDKAPERNSARKVDQTGKTDSYVNCACNHIKRLQRTIGNRAVQRLFKSGVLQTKLTLGRPNDIYEQEADSVAEQVMRMPETGIQTKPG